MSEMQSSQRNLSGRVYDPVFLCMVGAIVLAVGTSVVLRAMVGPGEAGNDMRMQPSPERAVPVTPQ